MFHSTQKEDLSGKLVACLQSPTNPKTLITLLRKIGRLPEDFNPNLLLHFFSHKNSQIRLLAVKNIGKLSNFETFLTPLIHVAQQDPSTMVRREAISSIGRMKTTKTLSFLVDMLKDEDPKIVLQCIRALLKFKTHSLEIRNLLNRLESHPNELIQSIIAKEVVGLSTLKVPKENLKNEQNFAVKYPYYLKNVVVRGDVLEIVKSIPEESIHLTFTSPPYYNARDYSLYQSYRQYLEFLRDVFKEVYRLTKEGRFFVLNTSPIILPRTGRQYSSKRYPIPFDIHPFLLEMGWEFIDDILWVKPEASVKNRNAGFLQHRKPLAYKPNIITEYIMVYRKKTHNLLDWNIHQYDKESIEKSKVLGNYETSNVWYIHPTFDRIHTAVFPLELCNRVISYYSYVDDLVFDPFAGSGTLGKAALNLSRSFFLTEIVEEYFDKVKKNIGETNIFMGQDSPRFLNENEFKEIVVTNE